jgi:hypothetical protein
MGWPTCMKQFMNYIVKKLNGVILKIDFEKAYDKVKWSFLQQTLRMEGFFISGMLSSIAMCEEVVWQLSQ